MEAPVDGKEGKYLVLDGRKLRRGNETGNEERGKERGKLQGGEADPKRGGRAGRQADKEGMEG